MAAATGLKLSGQPATFKIAQSVESGASREVTILPNQYKEVQGRMVRMEQKRLFLEDPMTVISERAEQVHHHYSAKSHITITLLYLLAVGPGATTTDACQKATLALNDTHFTPGISQVCFQQLDPAFQQQARGLGYMVSDMARRSEDKMRSSQGLATRERFDGQVEVYLTQGPKMIIVDFDYNTTLKDWSENMLIDAWEALEAINQTVDYSTYTSVRYTSNEGGTSWPASKYGFTMRDVLERIHSEVQYTQEAFTRPKLYTTLLSGEQAAVLSRAIDRSAALRMKKSAALQIEAAGANAEEMVSPYCDDRVIGDHVSSVLSGALVACTIGDTALSAENRAQLVSVLNLTAVTLISMDSAAPYAPPPCGILLDSLIEIIHSWIPQCPGMLNLLEAINTVLAAAHPTGRGRNLTDPRLRAELIEKMQLPTLGRSLLAAAKQAREVLEAAPLPSADLNLPFSCAPMAAPQAAEWAVKHLLSARINAVAETNKIELHRTAWFVGMAAVILDGALTSAIAEGALVVVPPTFISMKPVVDLVPNLEPGLKDALAMLVCWGMRDPVYTAYMDDASRSAIMGTVTAEGAAIKRLVSYLQVGMEVFAALGYAYPPDVERISDGGDLHHLLADGNSLASCPPPLVTCFTPRISPAETGGACLCTPHCSLSARHILNCDGLSPPDVHCGTLADHMTRSTHCFAPRISSAEITNNPCRNRRDACRHPDTNVRARWLQRSRRCLRLPRSSAVEAMASLVLNDSSDDAFRTLCLLTSLQVDCQVNLSVSRAFRGMTTRSRHVIREISSILINIFSYTLQMPSQRALRATCPIDSLSNFNVFQVYRSMTTRSRMQDTVRELRLILLNAFLFMLRILAKALLTLVGNIVKITSVASMALNSPSTAWVATTLVALPIIIRLALKAIPHCTRASRHAPRARVALTVVACLLLFAAPLAAQADTMHMTDDSITMSIAPFLVPGVTCAASAWDEASAFVTHRAGLSWGSLTEEMDLWGEAHTSPDFYGDDMTVKGPSTGCRLITFNAQRKLFKYGTNNADRFSRNMISQKADIVVVHEPGVYKRTLDQIQRALGGYWSVLYFPRVGSDGGGLVIMLSQSADKALDKVESNLAPDGVDSDRIVSLQFKHPGLSTPVKGQGILNSRLLLTCMYGYNTASQSRWKPWSTDTDAQTSLMKAATSGVRLFRKKYPKSSVLLAGDFNSSDYDDLDQLASALPASALGVANSDPDMRKRGAGYQMLDTLRSTGLTDTFRECHPTIRAVSRFPTTAQSALGHEPRRLDQVWATGELVATPTARAAIATTTPGFESDHRPTYFDSPQDIFGTAEAPEPLWIKNKVKKLTLAPDLRETSKAVLDYAEELEGATCTPLQSGPNRGDHTEWNTTMNAAVAEIHATIKTAALKTVMEERVRVEPNWVKKEEFKHMKSEDWDLNTRRNRVRHLVQKIHAGEHEDELTAAAARVPPFPVLEGNAKLTLHQGWSPTAISLALEEGDHDLLADALETEIEELDAYLLKEARSARAKEATDMRQRRVQLFDSGKVGATVRTVFRKAQSLRSRAWVRDSTGAVIDAASLVSEHVRGFVEGWMGTRKKAKESFTTTDPMEAIMSWDTDSFTPQAKLAADTFYNCGPRSAGHYIAKERDEGIWAGLEARITLEEYISAIRSFSSGKATGPSQIPAELLKWAHEDMSRLIVELFNECLQTGWFPTSANVATLLLIPKCPEGVTDMSQTRPIALMETLAKVYEKIIFDRTSVIMMEHEMFDCAQFGSLPGGGTDTPMFTMAGVFEHARATNSPLYLLSLDLAKAFDSLEYWSQAMTWRAFGMPPRMVKLILHLDATAETKVDLGNGNYTRPYRNGRGLRQGSSGGPIKWVAFMHWWLYGMKHNMRGKGYTVDPTKARGASNEPGKPVGDSSVELVTQGFCDDCNFATSSSSHMNDMLALIHRWVSFHALKVNMKKTVLLTNSPDSGEVMWPTGEPVRPVQDDHAVRYLGAWYAPDGGWGHQYDLVKTKLREQTDILVANRSHLSMRECRYLINRKLLPSVLHPLKVACLSVSQLKSLDKLTRAAFAKVAGISICDTPLELFHMKQEDGGWGIASVFWSSQVQTVKMWNAALNSPEGASVRQMADALLLSHKHLHEVHTNPLLAPHIHSSGGSPKTQVERLLLAMKLLGLRATTSDHVLTNPVGGWKEWCGEPQHHDIGIIHGLDWCQAERVRVQGPADGYTDGSTLGAALDRPRCGWGGVLVDKEVRLTAGVAPRWQGSGPITRPATNYHAEAMALLQTILKVNPTDPLHLFSDNASCVLACQNTGNDLTAATMAEMPASSTVMRLRLMIRARLQRGTETTVSWVHSHVDDPDRLQPKASTFRCACNDPNTLDAPVVPRCKPNHAAHLGNAFADTLAEEGVDQQREEHGADDISRTLKMRVSFESVRRGSSEQFSKLVEASVSEALLNSAIDRGKVRAQRLDLFLRASDPASRRHAMKTAVGGDSDLSERFLTRLWVGVLPTYSIIAKRIHSGSDNMTRAMYTPVGADDPIVDPCGTCRLCDSGKPETLQHILCECENPALHLIRVHAKDRVHADWQHSVLEPFPNPMEWEHESDWLPHWMWLGATPARLNTAIANTGQDPMPLLVDLRAAQDTLMSATHKMWETRNTLVLAWEESMGAKDTKAHVQRTGWTRSTAQTGERGRTRLAWGELSVATRRARERQQETAEVSAAILRPGETREQLARARKRDRTNRNHLEDLGTFQAAAARVPTPHDGPGHSAYDHNVKPRRRTPVVDRAMALGAGTFLRVRWPNENGRGVWWYGRVDHLVPRPDATAYHVIQYEGEDEMYRHDLTSGDTQYDVLQQEKPEPDDWCQQGQGTCTCGGDANHEHLWYEPNRLARAACHCEFCMYGAPVPASVPAGDYTGDGTGAAGELDTEIVEPSGGSDSDSADDTHSHVADDSGGEISDIPSEPNSESVNSGGEIDDTIDDPDPRISRIRSNNGPCRAGDGRARATSGRHEDRVHISAGKKPRRSARNKRKLSPERQSAEGFTEARQSEERATQPHAGHADTEEGTQKARRCGEDHSQLNEADQSAAGQRGRGRGRDTRARRGIARAREASDGTDPQGEVQVQTLECGRLPKRSHNSDQQHPSGLRVEGQAHATHAARHDERLLRGTERCETSSGGGIGRAACGLAEPIRRRPRERGQSEQTHRREASPEGRHRVVGVQEGEVLCKNHGSASVGCPVPHLDDDGAREPTQSRRRRQPSPVQLQGQNRSPDYTRPRKGEGSEGAAGNGGELSDLSPRLDHGWGSAGRAEVRVPGEWGIRPPEIRGVHGLAPAAAGLPLLHVRGGARLGDQLHGQESHGHLDEHLRVETKGLQPPARESRCSARRQGREESPDVPDARDCTLRSEEVDTGGASPGTDAGDETRVKKTFRTPTRKRHNRKKKSEAMMTDEQITRLMHEARKSRRRSQAQVDRIAGDVQRGKAAMRRCEEEADGGLQGGEIQKEGGSQAEDQDPGSSEGNGSEQETV